MVLFAVLIDIKELYKSCLRQVRSFDNKAEFFVLRRIGAINVRLNLFEVDMNYAKLVFDSVLLLRTTGKKASILNNQLLKLKYADWRQIKKTHAG